MGYELLMNLAVSGVAASAVSALFNWFVNRDLDERKAALDGANKESLARLAASLSTTAEEHQAALILKNTRLLDDHRDALARSRDDKLENIRAQLLKELKEHEAKLRIETEVEVVRWSKDHEVFVNARSLIASANDHFMDALERQQHPNFADRVKVAREAYRLANAAAAPLRDPFRKPVLAHVGMMNMWLGELEAVASTGGRHLIDENSRGMQFVESAVKSREAFDAFARELETRHRSTLASAGSGTGEG